MKGFGRPRQLGSRDEAEAIDAATVSAVTKSEPEVALEWGAIYEAHARKVASWVTRLSPELDAEDVVQEVFLTVRDKLPEFRGEAKLTTWLFRITQNVVRDRGRQEWRRKLRHLFFGEAMHSQPRSTPIESFEQKERAQVVYQVLDQLPALPRTVLILFEMEELSGSEVAELVGKSEAAVWVVLHRARKQFRARLQAEFPERFDQLLPSVRSAADGN